MAIAVTKLVQRFRYNGAELPYVAGHSPEDMRDLYSATYPELMGAEIVYGDIAGGVQEITFRRAAGVKG